MQIWSSEIKELESIFTSLKGRFPELEKELKQLIETEDANVVMLYSRRCLEVIITDLCEKELKRPRKTEPLKVIIDKLHKEEKVPSHIITSMDGLNSLSTYGAHPKKFDPRQVKPVLNNLSSIIEWYLKYKRKEEKHESKIPDDIKEHIVKPTRSKIWKIISYASILVIVALIVIYAASERKRVKDLSGIEKSIAVLPFENWSQSEEFAYLGDAIANEISTHLANIEGFHVLSFTSTSRFKGSDRPALQQVGRELRANFIIEGTVERQDQYVSINVQVIQAANDYHLWAEEFKGQWKDIFILRANITKKIAAKLQTILAPEEIKKIENEPTQDLEAYDYYLLGRNSWNHRSSEELFKAKSFFEKAIDTDPEFALAYAGLAQCYSTVPMYVSWRPGDAYPQAMTLALKTLELDSTLAEAYTAIGGIKDSYYWDESGAVKDFKHAIELNPNHSTTYHWYSETLLYSGFYRESVEMIRLALKIDPLSPIFNSLYGLQSYYDNQKDFAISYLQSMIKINPDIGPYHWSLGTIYLMEGEYSKSAQELELAVNLSGGTFYYIALLGIAYSKMGKLQETQKLLDKIEARTTDVYTSYFPKAILLSELGKKEEALKCLQKAYEERMELVRSLKFVDRFFFLNLRSDPRFIEITEKAWRESE